MVDCVKPNVILAMLFHDVSYWLHILNIPSSLLFYATDWTYRGGIWKVNLDGFDKTVIVTLKYSDVRSIAINYDKKRLCWADTCKCCTSLSPKYWVRHSIVAIMSLK